ncbi:ATP-binding cassette domain-containing protein [Alkalicaulis satelles]|uniref:ATP-binding cassette domain-containing protein n=1 Tax=Alkalicaulis satelles TaxID=2609175 RepID=A0A5M6ZD81_9PROT|nr:ATP-binding cassette domain-containing protein [Alkalicaulis satelles]KAA5801028.1 ATP-binding cassette domain-containing protein [Alkalicaulis satelles]
MSADLIIEVRGLRTQFGTHVVHDGLDLEVRRGEVLGIVGGSGSGKSVLLNSIIGLLQPAAGEIFIDGRLRSRLTDSERAALERRWGVLFQYGALFSALSVRENVMAPMREHLEISHALMAELADLKIALAGLGPEAAGKLPSELSGGMRKRAALARALALDPDILFLDEPTAGLDPIAAGKFDTLIRELSQTLGLTVVMITHDLDTLHAICDRVAVIAEKRVIANAPLDELTRHPHVWIQEYFGGPRGRAALRQGAGSR